MLFLLGYIVFLVLLALFIWVLQKPIIILFKKKQTIKKILFGNYELLPIQRKILGVTSFSLLLWLVLNVISWRKFRSLFDGYENEIVNSDSIQYYIDHFLIPPPSLFYPELRESYMIACCEPTQPLIYDVNFLVFLLFGLSISVLISTIVVRSLLKEQRERNEKI